MKDFSQYSDEELQALLDEAKKKVTPEGGMGMGEAALDVGMRGLDYAGGLVRTPVVGGVTGQLKADDIYRALQGQAPSTSEFAERAGVPEGGSLSDVIPGMYSETGGGLPLQKGGWADPTLRGTGGMGVDVALDPLTYMSLGMAPALKGAGAVAKAGRAAQGASTMLGRGMDKLGKMSYKAGLKKVDEYAAKYNKDGIIAPSEVLNKHQISGSAKNVERQADDVMSDLKIDYDRIVDEAAERGAEVDIRNALADAQAEVDKVLKAEKPDPALVPTARAAQKQLNKYYRLGARPELVSETASSVGAKPYYEYAKQSFDPSTLTEGGKGLVPSAQANRRFLGGRISGMKDVNVEREILQTAQRPVNVKEATGFKESLYGGMKSKDWELATRTPYGSLIQKKMAHGLKNSVEESVQATTGKGMTLNQTGQELGSLLTAKKALGRETSKETTKNAVSAVDAMAFSYAPSMWALKKGADISKGTAARTMVGRGLQRAGQSGIPDILMRRGAQERVESNYVNKRPNPLPGASTSAWHKVMGY